MRRTENADRRDRVIVVVFFGSVLVLYSGIALAIYLAVSAIVGAERHAKGLGGVAASRSRSFTILRRPQ